MSDEKDKVPGTPAPKAPQPVQGGDTVELDVHGEMIRRWRNMQREFQPAEEDTKTKPPPPARPS
jgi:hypothetical protein